MNTFHNHANLKRRKVQPGDPPGAVVIGGDYQGLGIVRSLGRHGVPVCIVDDEHSIARFSRHATMSVRVPNLRDENAAIASLMELGQALDLKGWVLFPTRDELVAAFSRHRDALSAIYRVHTCKWDAIQWIWDKETPTGWQASWGFPRRGPGFLFPSRMWRRSKGPSLWR